jgi:DNA-directed RNA polymerase sigma subunit (sigma70/sigma32)
MRAESRARRSSSPRWAASSSSPTSLAESLRDPAAEDAFEHATLRVAAGALPAVLATLTPRELAIVRGRFGIDGAQRSLHGLAAELCVSTERVRQIEQVAMRKLRESCDRAAAAA